MKPKRRTLQDVHREIIRSRLADFAAWRLALARFWRFDLVWAALHFRWVNARRRRALQSLARHHMSPDWRSSLTKRKQRKLGLMPPIQSHYSHANP